MIISINEIKELKELENNRKMITDTLEKVQNMSAEQLEELYREYYSNN